MKILQIIVILTGFFSSIFMFVFLFYRFVKMMKLQKESYILAYNRDLSFGKMDNAGKNPCEIRESFEIPKFSDNCDYLIK